MSSPDAITTRTIPKYGANCVKDVSPTLLVVLLGKTFNNTELQSAAKSKVHEALQERARNDAALFVSVSNVEKGEFGADGTLTDIYKASQKANDMQWPSVLIVDDLSARQLQGRPRIGEAKEGLYLHNPLNPIFVGDEVFRDAARVSAKALDAKPSLPTELKQRIESFLSQDSPFEALTDVPGQPSREAEHVDVISLVHLEPNQLRSAQKYLQEAAQEAHKANFTEVAIDVVLHQWKPHVPANRRDIYTVIRKFLDNKERPYLDVYLFLIDVPTKKEQNLVWAWIIDNRPVLLGCGSAAEALRRWFGSLGTLDYMKLRKRAEQTDELLDRDVELAADGSLEWLLCPSATLPLDMPPWLPATQVDVEFSTAPPVFDLTNKLTEEQNQVILDELYTLGDVDKGPKMYCIVPWNREEDGSVGDMCSLLRRAHNLRWGLDGPSQAIFIDRESPERKQVILADHRYVENASIA
ncbi:MAG: hypothetical protein M1822_004565 [Bathelium mastoideum]|nr:MAG: hypothetical protein M1822_004565 [Bathelium mastoideum]